MLRLLVQLATFASVTLEAACQTQHEQASEEREDQKLWEIQNMWARFQKQFGRSYPESREEALRFAAFRSNVARAYLLNKEQGTECTSLFDDENCVFGITKFSDMFNGEFKSTMLGYKPSTELVAAPILNESDFEAGYPTSVDWRHKGAVTPVKDQGTCGSCWAFSTVQEIESAVFMSSGHLPVLSTQQIISCDKKEGDQGCNGGDTVTAYKYVEKAGGLDSASDYPDTSHSTGRKGKCKWDHKKAAKITGFSYATKPCKHGDGKHQNETALAKALAAKGPVSVCLNAGAAGWQSYTQGIFANKKCDSWVIDMDHCVQLVGYNKSGPKPYWIVKNSWGTDWGMQGYMYLEMGKNLCGVANEATIAHASPTDDESASVMI